MSSNDIDGGFPIYILDDDTILFEKAELDHYDYWCDTVCPIVAKKYGIQPRKIQNMPYCQRRARIIGDILYYGEEMSDELFAKIEETVGMKLKLGHDDHETRCPISLAKFNGFKILSQL